MGLKFVVNDHALHAKHGDRYDAIGRWLLAGAVFVGFGLRYMYRFPDVVPVILQALLAGAVILNVLREELPAERQSRYWPFAIGAAAYAALLIRLGAGSATRRLQGRVTVPEQSRPRPAAG